MPGARFDVSSEIGEQLLAQTDAAYSEVVLPYLDGRDITRTTDQRPTRYTIDFEQMELEEALRYPAALEIVREQAKDARESSNSYSRNPRWWQFLWPRPEFRSRVAQLPRFIAGTATAKRIVFVWCDRAWRPSNSTNMFALSADYAMGLMSSAIHTEWARARSSTLEDRIRYTPSSAFETFPWPAPDGAAENSIGQLGQAILARRSEICVESGIGLTELYNQNDEGAWADLGHLHRQLDEAVLAAYGWGEVDPEDPAAINERLFDLNASIVAGTTEYAAPLAG